MQIDCDVSVRSARKLLHGLILFELGLVLVYALDTILGGPSWTIRQLFDLDRETSIPTWFSSAQWLLVALVLWFRSQQANADPVPSPRFLKLAAVLFAFLSADEAAAIRETCSRALRHMKSLPHLEGGLGIWVFIYGAIGLAIGIASLRVLLSMWRRHRPATTTITAGMAIVVLGAVVLEVIGDQFLRGSSTKLLYQVEVALEEFLEMAGSSVILYGSLLLFHPAAEAARRTADQRLADRNHEGISLTRAS
jgi:hypothetical protein